MTSDLSNRVGSITSPKRRPCLEQSYRWKAASIFFIIYVNICGQML